MPKIPKNLIDFLHWVKEQTELFWSIDPKTSTNDFVCEEWIYGAKWKGLTEEQINDIEKKYAIIFTPEHRLFLRILHTIDRKEKIEYTETRDGNVEVLYDETPFFYNWLEDEIDIKEKMDWPFKTIYEDVVGGNQIWLKSWGKRPNSEIQVKKIYSDWYKNTPTLIPLTSHRFLVCEPNLEYNPVLSIWGSDIIVYGWNLRSYLLNELQDHLNIKQLIYDDEDKCYYPELSNEVQTIFDKDFAFDTNKTIPYWQEMILIWTSGWSSFGMSYPGEEENNIHPILKTYIEEKENNSQKKFTKF